MDKKIKVDFKECKKIFDSITQSINIIHKVNLLELDSINNSRINNYKNADYTFNQIINSFDLTFNLLENKDPLNAMTILRNTYEEIMFLFSSFINNKLIVSVDSGPGDFRKIVKEHFNEYFNSTVNKEDLDEIYYHLSKVVHVSSVKETIKYLNDKTKYQRHIITEFKCELIIVECLLLEFMNKANRYPNDIYFETLTIVSYMSFLNVMLFQMFFEKKHFGKIQRFLYDAKTQDYISKQTKMIKEDLKEIDNNIIRINKKMVKEAEKLRDKYKDLGYEKII